MDAFLARTGPVTFEWEARGYLEECGVSLAGLLVEAEENLVGNTGDHF